MEGVPPATGSPFHRARAIAGGQGLEHRKSIAVPRIGGERNGNDSGGMRRKTRPTDNGGPGPSRTPAPHVRPHTGERKHPPRPRPGPKQPVARPRVGRSEPAGGVFSLTEKLNRFLGRIGFENQPDRFVDAFPNFAGERATDRPPVRPPVVIARDNVVFDDSVARVERHAA